MKTRLPKEGQFWGFNSPVFFVMRHWRTKKYYLATIYARHDQKFLTRAQLAKLFQAKRFTLLGTFQKVK